jgi:hypothetical protein
MPELPHTACIDGILRAAGQQKSVVCLSLRAELTADHEFVFPVQPGALVRAAIESAERMTKAQPFALHMQLPAAGDLSLVELLRDQVANGVQLGYTSFGIDFCQVPADQFMEVARSLLEPVLDLELALSVRLPVNVDKAISEQAAFVARQVMGLRELGARPDLVVLPGPDDIGGEAWRLATETAPLIVPTGLAWNDCDPKGLQIKALSQAFVRAVSEPLMKRQQAVGSDLDANPEKTEALAYLEALDRFCLLGLNRTSELVLRSLEVR